MITNIEFTSLALAINTTLADSSPELVPQWVQVIPAGEMSGRDGRKYINNDPDKIIESFRSSGKDSWVDINHGSYQKNPPDPLVARSVGWIKELQNRLGAIWARIEWTIEGANLISSKAFRYLSPALIIDSKTNSVKALDSVGLVNSPNLQLPALNHEDRLMPTEQEIALQQQLNGAQAELNQVKLEATQAKTEITRLQTELNAQLELVKQQQDAIFKAELNSIFTEFADRVPPAKRVELTELAVSLNTALGTEAALKQFKILVSNQQVIGGAVNLDHSVLNKDTVALNTAEQDAIALLGIKPELYAASKQSLKTQFPVIFGAS